MVMAARAMEMTERLKVLFRMSQYTHNGWLWMNEVKRNHRYVCKTNGMEAELYLVYEPYFNDKQVNSNRLVHESNMTTTVSVSGHPGIQLGFVSAAQLVRAVAEAFRQEEAGFLSDGPDLHAWSWV